MVRFLLKGIIRDRSRSLLPIIIISIGVSLTVLLSGYMKGVMGDMIEMNAKFETGHLKVVTKAYLDNITQVPNDLALLDIDELHADLNKSYPQVQWVNRIKFGGLLDVPDENGETVAQGPGSGIALNLLDKNSGEIERFNLESSLVDGHMPTEMKEILIGEKFAKKLGLSLGSDVTFFGTTMNGSMTFFNFKVSGLVQFGTAAMDRSMILMDISAAQNILDMDNATGEILGFDRSGLYNESLANEIRDKFNAKYSDEQDEYAPIMVRLRDQAGLAEYLDYVDVMSGMFVGIFIFAMSIVLWNTGILGGLRRYKEFGIRLALGESKGDIYRSLVYEAVLIGVFGSVIGTVIGLGGTWYLQEYGIDISDMMGNSTAMMPSVLKARLEPQLLYIGFIPGLFAMVFGNMLSGIGIYKRETSRLFKELEV